MQNNSNDNSDRCSERKNSDVGVLDMSYTEVANIHVHTSWNGNKRQYHADWNGLRYSGVFKDGVFVHRQTRAINYGGGNVLAHNRTGITQSSEWGLPLPVSEAVYRTADSNDGGIGINKNP